MLRKIKKLKNIGILNENSFKSVFLLEKKNSNSTDSIEINRVLMFGENSSGKSTFSKIFRSIELFGKEPEKSIKILNNVKSMGSKENIEIELQTDSSIIKFDSKSNVWKNHNSVNMRVFNSDYVRENINLNDFVNNKIDNKYESEKVLLSKEKNEYENALKIKNEKVKNHEKILEEYFKKKSQFETKYKTIFDYHCIPSFDRQSERVIDEKQYKDLQKKIQDAENSFQKLKKSETFFGLNKIENNYLSDDNVSKCTFDLNFSEDAVKIKTFNEMLSISEEEREWKLLGLKYIDKKNQCPFCKSNISGNEIIQQYEDYLKSDSKNVENSLKIFKNELQEINNELANISNLELSVLNYSSLIQDYSYGSVDKEMIIQIIEECNKIIDNKILNVFTKISDKEAENFFNGIDSIKRELKKVDILNEYVLIINDVMSKASTKLKTLRQSVKELLSQLFSCENKSLIEKLNKSETEKITIENEFNKKEKEYLLFLQNNNDSIKIINEYISYLGLTNYRIDSEFNLIYSNNKINDAVIVLSDGEISALVFAYFCATLVVSNTEEEKKNMIIVIDDPVTSVDYNRIYYFASMIRNISEYVCENIKTITPPQLIVLTHNYLLFNILLQSRFIMGNKKTEVFEFERKDNESKLVLHDKNKDTIFIKQLVKIIECAHCSDITPQQEIMIPNCIRSVVEQLLYFINPNYESSKKKDLVDFFGITNKEYDILDFYIQHNSHNEPVYNIEGKFTKNQLSEQCNIVAQMIKNRFDKLYEYCSKKIC
ncbi:MAG: AAA family ATPase [Bacilli bacterium]|nr:AAA family ATPase [Bacilli bacterium]MDD4795873.1 AAA family ATPase [Bacilli bacterium]